MKEKVNHFLINDMEMEESLVQDHAHLVQDLGMTSLDFVDLKAFIRKEFGLSPESDDMKNWDTLEDVYTYIFSHAGQS